MTQLALGPEITVEQLLKAQQVLQGQPVPNDLLFAPIPDDPQEREAFLKIIEDLLAEVS